MQNKPNDFYLPKTMLRNDFLDLLEELLTHITLKKSMIFFHYLSLEKKRISKKKNKKYIALCYRP